MCWCILVVSVVVTAERPAFPQPVAPVWLRFTVVAHVQEVEGTGLPDQMYVKFQKPSHTGGKPIIGYELHVDIQSDLTKLPPAVVKVSNIHNKTTIKKTRAYIQNLIPGCLYKGSPILRTPDSRCR